MSVIHHERARVGALSRSRPADDPELLDAKRKLAAANLAAHVEKALAAAPPLTEQQLTRIAAILRTAGTNGGAA